MKKQHLGKLVRIIVEEVDNCMQDEMWIADDKEMDDKKKKLLKGEIIECLIEYIDENM